MQEVAKILKSRDDKANLYSVVIGPDIEDDKTKIGKSVALFDQFVKILALSATDPSYKLIYTDNVYSEGESKDMLGNEMVDNGIENIFRRIGIEKNIIKLTDFFTRDE